MIAATAMCHIMTPQLATSVSGYSLEDLKECYDWMAAFAITVHEMGPVQLKTFSKVAQDDMHNIQTHSVDLETLVCEILLQSLSSLTIFAILCITARMFLVNFNYSEK